MLAFAAVRIDLLRIAAVRLAFPHSDVFQQLPASLRRFSASASSLRRISANPSLTATNLSNNMLRMLAVRMRESHGGHSRQACASQRRFSANASSRWPFSANPSLTATVFSKRILTAAILSNPASRRAQSRQAILRFRKGISCVCEPSPPLSQILGSHDKFFSTKGTQPIGDENDGSPTKF